MNKKIFILFAIIFIFSLKNAFGADYKIDKYDIDAVILENGDMQVTEKIRYDFDDDMNGLFRELLYSYTYNGQKDDLNPASKRYQASNIEGLSVWYSDTSFDDMKIAIKKDESSLSNGMNGYYSVERIDEEEKKDIIKVYTPVKEGRRKYVKYIYTVKDVVVNYNDYAEIYWNFIGGDWQCSINGITINLSLPVETNIKAYYHTFGDIMSFRNDGKVITLRIPELYSGVAADIRAVFPNNILRAENIKKQINEDYDFDELEKVEEVLKSNMENYKKYRRIFFGELFTMPFIILLIALFTGNSKDGRIRKKSKAEVYTEILDNYTLDEYYKILSPYNSLLSGNIMIATLMDLSHKKVINMNPRKNLTKSKDSYDYYVSINKKANFDDLTDYEKIIINYIFFKKDSSEIDSLNAGGEEFELNERFKELSNNTKLAEKVRKKVEKVEKKYKGKHYDSPKMDKYKPIIVISVIILLAFLVPIFMICPNSMRAPYLFGCITASLICFAAGSLKTAISGIVIKSEYLEEYNKMQGLYKYLDEYSLLKERYPIEIELWDKYMVFACLFGIAKKVAKEFKEELLSKGMTDEDIYTYYPYMYIGNHYHTYASSISSAAYSGSGSSSSGGFSGGGGGGRRWRRRWRFLNYIKKEEVT